MTAPQWWLVVDRATGEGQVVQDRDAYDDALFAVSPVDGPANGQGAHVDGVWTASFADNFGAGLEAWLNGLSRVDFVNHILALVDQRIAASKEPNDG
jgi:hypothetical protein